MKNIKKKNTIIYFLIIVVALLLCAVAILWWKIPSRAVAKIRSVLRRDVCVYEEKVDIEGLEEPFTIIFIADSHIALCDSRDSSMKEISKARYDEFKRDSKGADGNFSILMDSVKKEKPDLVIFGGDITDAATYASVEFVEKEIEELDCPYIYCMGNHDFTYMDEYFSEKAYSEYRPRFQNLNDEAGCSIAEYDDFIVLALDDANNRFCEEACDVATQLKKTGKPVVLVTHVPFVPLGTESDLISATNEVWGAGENGNSRVLIGEKGCYPDENTKKIIDFASDEDGPVKLILAGHIHFFHEDFMNSETLQITSPPAYERGYVKVTLF